MGMSSGYSVRTGLLPAVAAACVSRSTGWRMKEVAIHATNRQMSRSNSSSQMRVGSACVNTPKKELASPEKRTRKPSAAPPPSNTPCCEK